MIVIGADTHKDTHTAVAVLEGTGQITGELTAAARKQGFAEHLDWARELDPERVWAIEDCRHVSGGFEIVSLVKAKAPELLAMPGCGALSAAKILAETAGVERFSSDAKLARLAGVAPIPASSGRRDRHRLDRGGNRQLNCALHRIAVTQGRVHPPAREFLARKQAEGKSRMEALRCLKRHLARRVWRLLNDSEIDRSVTTIDSQRDTLAPQAAVAA
jgi:transposase